MIKLVLSDMDGTLLKENKEMPKDTFQVFEQLLASDVACGVATGRSLTSLFRDFKQLSEQLTFIAENGAIVYHQGQLLYKEVMKQRLIDRILNVVLPFSDLIPVLAAVDKTYTCACSEAEVEHLHIYYPHLEIVDDLYAVDDEIVKMTVYHRNQNAVDNLPLFDGFGKDANVSVSGKEWIDFSSKGVNKGNGIKALQEHLHITAAQCMAFGDYMNDYEMMLSVGESYAMGNAYGAIKDVSKYVIGTNEEEAVLQVIVDTFQLKMST